MKTLGKAYKRVKGKEGFTINLIIDGDFISELHSKDKNWAEKILVILKQMGDVRVSKLIISQQEGIADLIETAQEFGINPIIVPSDVDLYIVLNAAPMIRTSDSLAVLTNNLNLVPLLMRAREKGNEVILLTTKSNNNVRLENVADHIIFIDKLE